MGRDKTMFNTLMYIPNDDNIITFSVDENYGNKLLTWIEWNNFTDLKLFIYFTFNRI